jgi:DNA helicase-2/ATP-dependent DNA helicase PcrA
VRLASWQVASVTGERLSVRTRSARVRAAMAPGEGTGADLESGSSSPATGRAGEAPTAAEMAAGAQAAAAPGASAGTTAGPAPLSAESASERADAGAAWGTLVHGLLEHAMRHAGAPRADLERLARWFAIDQPELRAAIPAALDLVEAVSRSTVWLEARAAGEVLAEVPFAVRVDQPASGPRVLRGVIDLVYRLPDGWRIVDYKTDAGASDPRGLLERHAGQLGEYRAAWAVLTGEPAPRVGVFALRTLRIAWTDDRGDPALPPLPPPVSGE